MGGFLFFGTPIPVVVNENGVDKEGYAIYIESGGMFENDCWTVALCDSGIIRHYTTNNVKAFFNATYGIKKKPDEQQKG